MKKLNILFGLRFAGVLLAFIASGAAQAGERDSQLWLALDKQFWQTENTKAYFYAETRYSDGGLEMNSYYYGPRLSYKLDDHWSLGTAAKSINLRQPDGDFRDLYRFELEATYAGKIGEQGKMDLRNRVESIHEEGKEGVERYRHRLRYTRTLNGHGSLKSFYISDEILYGERNDSYRLQQNRFIPIGLNFATGEDSVLSVYYLYQYRANNRGGVDVHVLGLSLNF